MKKSIILSISALLITVGCNNNVDTLNPPITFQSATFSNHDYPNINNSYSESTDVQKGTAHPITDNQSKTINAASPSTVLIPIYTETTTPIYVNGKQICKTKTSTVTLRPTANKHYTESDIDSIIKQRKEHIEKLKKQSETLNLQPFSSIEIPPNLINNQSSILAKPRQSIENPETIHDATGSTI